MKRTLTKNLSLLLIASMASANISFAASNFKYQQNYAQPQPQYQGNYYPQEGPQYVNNTYGRQTLKGRVVTVPAGITVPAVVTTPISSEFLSLGQPVCVTLGSDFYYNSTLIAPAGSNVTGTVTQVTKAKLGSMNGSLKLRFTEITTPYGLRVPISAVIKTDDGTGVLKGGTKADVAKN